MLVLLEMVFGRALTLAYGEHTNLTPAKFYCVSHRIHFRNAANYKNVYQTNADRKKDLWV